MKMKIVYLGEAYSVPAVISIDHFKLVSICDISLYDIVSSLYALSFNTELGANENRASHSKTTKMFTKSLQGSSLLMRPKYGQILSFGLSLMQKENNSMKLCQSCTSGLGCLCKRYVHITFLFKKDNKIEVISVETNLNSS